MWHAWVGAVPLLLLAAGTAQAASVTSTWTGGTGDWGAAGNWSPSGVPNNGGGNSFDVRIDGGAAGSASSVNLNINATVNTFAIDGGDTLKINDGNTLTFGDDSSNAGTLGVVAPGTGELRFGTGIIHLQNSGTLKADGGGTFRLRPGSGISSITNTGSLLATGGGTLKVELFAGVDNAGGSIEAQDASQVQLLGGAAVRGGTLSTTGTGTIRLLGNSPLVNLSNTGLFLLGDGATANLSGASGGGGSTVSNSGTMAITAPGTASISVSSSNAQLDNSGTIKADGADTTLRLRGTLGNYNNTGSLLATNGGTLKLEGVVLNNTGGGIQAQDGSEVQLQSLLGLRGGTLGTTGSGVVRATGNNTMRNLGNTGLLMLNDGAIATVGDFGATNLLSNSGAIAVAAAGNARIQIDGLFSDLSNSGTIKADGSTLLVRGSGLGGVTNTGTLLATGGGTMRFELFGGIDNAGGTIQAQNGSEVQLADNTSIRGGTLGTAGSGVIRQVDNTILRELDNTGMFVLNGGTTALVAVGGSNAVTNSGTMAVTTGAATISVERRATLANTGTLRVDTGAQLTLAGDGRITHAGGSLLVNGTLVSGTALELQGGSVSGSGTIAADLVNGGQINPGNSPGILTIDGDYTQEADGILTIQIGGLLAGLEFDQLQVTGNALLAGTLEVDLIDGFVPLADAAFDILLANAVSGTFSILDLPMTANGSWDVAYLGNLVRLTFDFDESGGSQVPEPTGMALLLAGLGMLGARRRR